MKDFEVGDRVQIESCDERLEDFLGKTGTIIKLEKASCTEGPTIKATVDFGSRKVKLAVSYLAHAV